MIYKRNLYAMTQQETKDIIINRTLEIEQSENGIEYTIHFYKIDHLLTGLSVLNFSTISLADYITKIFSPSLELNKPTFFNVIEESPDEEIHIYTILAIVKEKLINHQSICVSDEDRKLLHLVTLDEYYNPDVKK